MVVVKQVKVEAKTLFACAECGFAYAQRALAENCEAWCRKHKSCNLEIAKHAVRGPAPRRIK